MTFILSIKKLSTILLPGGSSITIECKLFHINIISKLVCVPISVVLSLFLVCKVTICLRSQDVVVCLEGNMGGRKQQ